MATRTTPKRRRGVTPKDGVAAEPHTPVKRVNPLQATVEDLYSHNSSLMAQIKEGQLELDETNADRGELLEFVTRQRNFHQLQMEQHTQLLRVLGFGDERF